MSEDPSLRPHAYGVEPGLEPSSGADPDLPTRVGSIWIPAYFTLYVYEPDPRTPEFVAAVQFHVIDSVILARSLASPTHEVDEAMARLLAIRSMDGWKREALTKLASGERPPGWWERNPMGPKWTDPTPRGALEDRIARTPLRRARNRITPEHLRAVADVYREAWSSGSAPTMAVSDHWHTSHSSAARWVGLAREAGYLGPADGSRGGEVER